MDDEERRNLDFLQAEGFAPLPRPLNLKEISQEMRAAIYDTLKNNIDSSASPHQIFLDHPWKTIANDIYARHIHGIGGEMGYKELINYLSSLIKEKSPDAYAKICNFLQFIMRHKLCEDILIQQLKQDFERCRAAYFIDDSILPITILPKSFPEEGEAITESIKTLKEKGQEGALQHIRQAGVAINKEEWADSVKESIHAVESAARKISGKKSLEKALDSIDNLHPALKGGLNKLYGYTSDEQGIRHALIDKDSPNVKEDIAIYMYGACASFASYLSKQKIKT